MRWFVYLLSILFAGCNACTHPKPNSNKVVPKRATTVEEPLYTLKKTLNGIRVQQGKIVAYKSKNSPAERTYHSLVSLINSSKKQIERAQRKLSKLEDFAPLDELEESLTESIEIGVEELEGMQEELVEEYEGWTSTIAAMFDLKSHEVEEHINWLYEPNTAGNFLIHEWAYQDGEVLADDPFVIEKTIDINCRNREGFTALQIVMGKLIAAEGEETRKESIEKLYTLLRMWVDLTVFHS
jgi:hypothetical protein